MRSIAVFKNPSKLKVVLSKPVSVQVPMLSQAKRGELFLRNGAVCMRVDVGLYELESRCPPVVKVADNDQRFAVINLQTGRVWFSADQEVEFIKATLTVDGE
jgi:hypothetical protein